MSDANWNQIAREYLRDELAEKQISHSDLVGYLSAIGIPETKASIDSKICRGTFSAAFLLQCLTAIGSKKMESKMIDDNIVPLRPSGANKDTGLFQDMKTGTKYVDTSLINSLDGDERPTVVSLFSGAGGLDIGLEQAGYETLVCVDNDLDCRITLKHNRPNWVVFDSMEKTTKGEKVTRDAGDIRQIEPRELLKAAGRRKGEITLVVGGAPCQPFSNMGMKQGKHDEQNGDLFLEFVKMVKGIEPKAFIFENVAGITQQRHAEVIQYMLEQFSGMKYGISHTVLNAANYGVGQRRERFILLGIKGVKSPAFPLPTHFRDQSSWGTFVRYFDSKPGTDPEDWISIQQVFDSLPKGYRGRSDYAVMNVTKVVKDRMKLIKQGQNFHVLPTNLRPECWKTGKHQGADTLGRLVEDAPSVTIRTAAYNPSKGRYIHPTEDRGLNTIEMAAIQGFPYDWVFRSAGREQITLVSAGRQIGNAVPPPLAKALGESVRIQIKQKKSEVTRSPKKLRARA